MNLSKSTTYDCSFALWKHPQFSPWTQPRVLVESWVSVPEKIRNFDEAESERVMTVLREYVPWSSSEKQGGKTVCWCIMCINMKSTEIYLQWWTHDCMSAIGERCCFSKDVVVKEKKFHKKNVFDSGNRRLDIFIINHVRWIRWFDFC